MAQGTSKSFSTQDPQTLSDHDIQTLIDSCKLIPGHYHHTLSIDPPIPSEDYPVDKEKQQQWIELHSDEYRACAQKLTDHIQYVDFAQFYAALIHCAQQLNSEYKRENIKGEDVILAVPFLSEPKSNTWVVSLLLKHLEFKPLIIMEGLDPTAIGHFLKQNPGVKRVLLADDASYSAVDLRGNIRSLKASIVTPATIDLIVPYATNKAKKRLQKVCRLFTQHTMPTLSELPFTAEERFLLSSFDLSGSGISSVKMDQLTLTYFAHKMADSYSTAEKILKYGIILSTHIKNHDFVAIQQGIRRRPENFNSIHRKFIPDIMPCYKDTKPKAHLSSIKRKSALQPQ
ncbi:MAG: hypothetical protein ACHQJ6_05860 [Candidatus Berkiellales bacterium]